MTDGIVIPARFGSPTERARQALSEDLARLVIPYLNDLGWDTVVNDLLTVAAGFVSQWSKSPAGDLEKAAIYLRRYDWKRAKRLYFAAQQGIRPEQVTEEMLAQAVDGPRAARDTETSKPTSTDGETNHGEH